MSCYIDGEPVHYDPELLRECFWAWADEWIDNQPLPSLIPQVVTVGPLVDPADLDGLFVNSDSKTRSELPVLRKRHQHQKDEIKKAIKSTVKSIKEKANFFT